MKRNLIFLLVTIILTLSPAGTKAQGGGQHMLFGDLKIDESKATGIVPISFDIILYTKGGNMVARQPVTNNGRYRFMNLHNGEYYLVVEMENSEVARITLTVASPTKTDIRQDIALEWRPDSADAKRGKVGNISVADYYERAPANKKLFAQAAESTDKKKYDQSLQLLRRIVDQDPKDFQAWTELGTIYLLQSNATEAEKAYVRAIEERPAFVLALLNLGRLRIMEKKYESAIEPLNAAVKLQPKSANAN